MPPRRRSNRNVKVETNSQESSSEVEEVDTSDDSTSEEEVVVEESNKISKRKGDKRSSAGSSQGTKQKSPAKASQRPLKEISGPVLSTDEMVQNTLLYLLLMQHKKLPIKRSEIVKHAMNSQSTSFPEVMDKIKDVLDQKFGINLLGIEESRGRIKGYSSYILVSKYPMVVTESANAVQNLEEENKRSILYLILAVIFMLERPIDEGTVWKIISDLSLNQLICKKREDLHRFIKQEFVSKMFLNVEEVKESDDVDYRYSWGLRAEKEFSKYSILKFVTKHFPGKIPEDFVSQFNIVMEDERDAVELDRMNNGNDTGNHDEMELEDLDVASSQPQASSSSSSNNVSGMRTPILEES